MPLRQWDLLSLDASALQRMFAAGKTTSHSLVNQSLAQIAKYDRNGPCLRAMTSVVPCEKLLQLADERDRERANGNLRGPFHGIPVIVKVCHAAQSWDPLLTRRRTR